MASQVRAPQRWRGHEAHEARCGAPRFHRRMQGPRGHSSTLGIFMPTWTHMKTRHLACTCTRLCAHTARGPHLLRAVNASPTLSYARASPKSASTGRKHGRHGGPGGSPCSCASLAPGSSSTRTFAAFRS